MTVDSPTASAARLEALPVIDIGPLVAGDGAAMAAVAARLGAACREIGFFYVTGHGVPQSVMDGIVALSRRLFALPQPLKSAVSIERSPHNRGYAALGGETLAEGAKPDMKEAFNIGLDLAPDDPEVVDGRPFRGINQWPDLPGLRAEALDYYDRMLSVGLALHRGFALDLGLAPDHFAAAFRRPLATLRLLHYPARPDDGDPDVMGAGTHTDYGNATLLLTDGVPGLEVRRRDGAWLPAPHLPGAFICNIGDLLMRWSNGIYVSTPHRVRNQPGRERLSVAFFMDPDPDALVACLPTCAGPETPPRWPPITAGEYLAQRLDATYAFRRREAPADPS